MTDLRTRLERLGFRGYYRLADLTYALGVATPKRTVAGRYWSYEPTNPHGDDPGLAALADLPSDATVFDVGAHVGEHAIPLAVGTDRRVVAFEPNGESADRLARNARRNGLDGSVDLRRIGLGDANDELTFYRSTFSKCSAFDRADATRWGASVAAAERVPIRRLDDLLDGTTASATDGTPTAGPVPDPLRDSDPLPDPDAIKVDVEGHELAVLRGAAGTIDRCRPLLVVETHGADDAREVRSWVTDRGYAVDERGDVLVCRSFAGP
ncbi:FkbM family methyltransferase [Halorubrum sp. JWXQ-INN 858]|uniref:FkbM family methyltransferase n=1 Tax=Halorubrum sp. JWXQ-INN 858 TaxID=2690782 RepID=UPI001356DA16|nr:FkbM family methyltransferase [Halorubrum sp. JWXQ-INN 858]MWV63754.1 FkbM family methyltransferase [Halorubrum sp. JWXQ-INN 858]